MIDKKKIEEAAQRHVDEMSTYYIPDTKVGTLTFFTEEDVRDTFKAGAEWYRYHLWHDISDCNKKDFDDNAVVMGLDRDGQYYLITGAELWADQKDYIIWCYISDL